MIRSFRSKALQRYFETGEARKLSVPNVGRLSRVLRALDTARVPAHLNLPGFRFHALKGNFLGRYSVDASGNWRVTFAWDGEDAVNVDLEDYH